MDLSGLSVRFPRIADTEPLTIVAGMWRNWVVASFAALAACHSRPPSDCAVALKQGLQCGKRVGSGHDREMLLACFPFSKPERIGGAWVFGFEVNRFYEGERASADILKGDVPPPSRKPVAAGNNTTLVFNSDVPADGKLRMFQIDFVGRRAECPITPEREIVVDRVLSRTLKGVVG